MAATTDSDQARIGALSYMYETGSWADLSIVTATKTFRVHKCVVFPQNEVFYSAACAKGIIGLKNSTFRVDENEVVVDALLRHLYELPIAWLEQPPSGLGMSDQLLRRGTDCVRLMVAAGKYDLEELGDSAMRMFQSCMSSPSGSAVHMIDLGCLFMDLTKDLTHLSLYKEGREFVATATHHNLAEIATCTLVWKKLYANEEFMRQVMFKAASIGREATKKRSAPDED
ncbi:unnamed protein product [Zymoseptoria tritici ST99CH_3D1]|nr:unnamed protein product [Zymoseptoria tritici ST99CH_3D1]